MNAIRLPHPALLVALVAALLTFAVSPAIAQDAPDREPPAPETVADNTLERIDGIVERTLGRIEKVETKILEKIEELGDDDGVGRVARRGGSAISRDAATSVRAVRNQARRATALLNRLEADPALIDSVQTAAQDAIEELREARKAAVEAIRDAAGIEAPPSTE
ncbi:MAG: hypothetical protein AAGF84_11185 [Planctomycetota bacterium]